MSYWTEKKCQDFNDSTVAIAKNDALDLLQALTDWELSTDGKSISRRYSFKNFKQTMFFVNAVAFVVEREGHHPDVTLGYNYCNVLFTTHELGGLSDNDFICAAKINQLL